ncbi:MAG: beta-N-acetylglucosaminidase domain-containing protein [Brachybacterium sp.]|uniref:beta-N-acetylglucosaminidase domain-containing protein n=1 Tax=Brachybacterium sp. TaxID=1891286 RepID=UPI0026494B00|nr:beta-N-acetylglucosaminidase domain-containing protein [Brachybacterium sp.]MDN5687954.1 beta-N-acetylglucosaminidase domain-containing protein [Brachybacterium sp.]
MSSSSPADSTPVPRVRGLSRRHALGLGLALGGTLALPLPAALADGSHGSGSVSDLRPRPRSVQGSEHEVVLRGKVTVVIGAETDAAAQDALAEVLQSTGSRVRTVVADSADDIVAGPRIHLGTPEDNPTIAVQLEAAGVPGPDGLAADGYVLATGRNRGPVVTLAGRDARGTYYAVQTLRQLLAGGARVPAVHVRDAPRMEIRGAIEGFYGIPWSHQARLDHFAFYGAHKLNTYIYTPKDDLLLRSKWRELYEGEELEKLAELVGTASAHHVSFTYALSPGNDITYGSDEDYEATVTKFEQLRDLGVTRFYIALDDIPGELDDADAAQFASLAEAQAHYLTRLQDDYVQAHGLEPLETVPTHYAGSEPSAYKRTFGEQTHPDVRIQWTGEGVFSPEVTEDSVVRAVESYHTDHLFIWDNFPVNDGRRDRLFLNPLEGRAPTLHEHIAGFTSNPMIEPYASLIALANYADYCWDPIVYDAEDSWRAVLDELAGADEKIRHDLRVFVDLNLHWPYRDGSPTAPALSADVDAFWAAYDAGSDGGQELSERLATIVGLEDSLEPMASPGFYADTLPWITAAGHWADALGAQVEMLQAIAEDRLQDASAAAARVGQHIEAAGEATVPDQRADGVHREDQIVPSVGDGVFETFVSRAWEELRAVLPEDPSLPFRGLPATASTTLGTYQDYAPQRMVDGDLATMFWSDAAPQVDDEIRIDLDETHPITFARVQMAGSDTTAGDQIYEGVLELSADGESWTQVAATDGSPLLEVTLPEAQEARAARLRVTGKNPGGKWVQVREFGLGETAPAA